MQNKWNTQVVNLKDVGEVIRTAKTNNVKAVVTVMHFKKGNILDI